MTLYLYTAEKLEASLSHGAILCTQEQADEYYLMHYRRGGEKKGVRRFQDEQGRLTPEGYRHYAEMYGWGSKLKRAKKLQNDADRKSAKAESAARRSDEDIVSAYKANQKNERRTTDRRQMKADQTNARSAQSRAEASKASLDARKAQDKATVYADKLARKDEKLSKYMNDDGTLNEEGLKKYTVPGPTPGSHTMSLVGRLKFGKDISDRVNQQNRMTKDEYKDWERKEKAEFDKESREEQMDRAIEKEDLNAIHKEAGRRLAERGITKPSTDEIVAEMGKIGDEAYLRSEERDPEARREADIEYYTGGQGWNKYRQADIRREFEQGLDNMNVSERRQLGNGLMDCLGTVGQEIADKSKRGEKIDRKDYTEYDTMAQWLTDEIYERSGSWNSGEFKSGSKAKPAYEKINEIGDQMDARANSVKKKLGLDGSKANWYSTNPKDKVSARLQQALKKDDVWISLNKAYDNAEKDLCGAILQDLGFPDNYANRSIIMQYAFID